MTIAAWGRIHPVDTWGVVAMIGLVGGAFVPAPYGSRSEARRVGRAFLPSVSPVVPGAHRPLPAAFPASAPLLGSARMPRVHGRNGDMIHGEGIGVRGLCAVLAGVVATLYIGQARAEAQIPDTFRNLQELPEDTDRAALLDVMRGFSFALGVRCQYCHVGGDGTSFEGVAFDSDDDPDKLKARAMLAMVRDLNDIVLAALPDRDAPPIAIQCKTCHRGRPRPVLLAQELRMALDDFGSDSATARYERFLADEDVVLAGWFDFGEWEVNTLAERLQGEGRTADAIAIYELNARHHPGSISIHSRLGALHEAQGDPRAAILSYERVLEIDPENQVALSRLRALRGGGPNEARTPFRS